MAFLSTRSPEGNLTRLFCLKLRAVKKNAIRSLTQKADGQNALEGKQQQELGCGVGGGGADGKKPLK